MFRRHFLQQLGLLALGGVPVIKAAACLATPAKASQAGLDWLNEVAINTAYITPDGPKWTHTVTSEGCFAVPAEMTDALLRVVPESPDDLFPSW